MLNRVNDVFVTNTTADNTGTTVATIIDGDILILNRAMSVLTGTPTATSAADNDQIYLMLGIGTGSGKLSSPIQLKQVTSVKRTAYSAAAQEVFYIGYNESSSTLTTPVASTEYALNIVFKDDQHPSAVRRQTRRTYSYVTPSTGSSIQDSASAFVAKINADKFTNVYIDATVVTNGSFSASSGGAFTVTTDSNTITVVESAGAAADAGKYAADASSMAVGDYIRIGGTGVSSPVYKITAVSGIGTAAATITLSTPYQGASGSVSAANVGVMTSITAAGIKLVGKAVTLNALDPYMIVNFDASMYQVIGNDSSITPESTTLSTKPFGGQGTYALVRDIEEASLGYDGKTNRTLFPANTLPAVRASSASTYNLLTIEYFNEHPGDLQFQMKSPHTVVLAFHSASAPTKSTKETTIIDILESLFESVGIFVE